MRVLISVRGGERWRVIHGVQIAGTWMKVGSTVVISVGNYAVTRVCVWGGEYTPHDVWWGLTGMGRPARRHCPRCGSEAEWIGSIKRQA